MKRRLGSSRALPRFRPGTDRRPGLPRALRATSCDQFIGRHRPIAALKIPLREVVAASGSNVGQRIEPGRSALVFVDEPELISAQHARPHQLAVVGRRNELRALGVGVSGAEQCKHGLAGMGVETRVQFVDAYGHAFVQRHEHHVQHDQQSARSGALAVQTQKHRVAVMTAMSQLDGDLLVVSVPVGVDRRLQHPMGHRGYLALESSVFFRQFVFLASKLNDSGTDLREKVDHSPVRLLLDEIRRSCLPRDGHSADATDRPEIRVDAGKLLVTVLRGRGHIQAVRPDQGAMVLFCPPNARPK